MASAGQPRSAPAIPRAAVPLDSEDEGKVFEAVQALRRARRRANTEQILAGVAISLAVLFFLSGGGGAALPGTYYSLFLSLGSNATAARHLRSLTLRPHLAGLPSSSFAAAYVASVFSSCYFPAHSARFSVLLSYPVRRSLSISSPSLADPVNFNLTQRRYPPSGADDGVVPTFLAYAASGTVTAEAVFANYGRVEDFEYLKLVGLNVSGKIVLARYGKIFRGDIVSNARSSGAIGVVIYSDKKDYGAGIAYPDGPWLPPSGVQIGSTFRGVGDPTTPGWASDEGCERVPVEEVMRGDDMPKIPALPVSSSDGEMIMKQIGGPIAPEDWQGTAGSVLYRLGPGPAVLTLTYEGNETITTIENVFAIIEGKEEPDRLVLLGNHRDAWTFGAVDPNSGTATLLEIAERFEKLKKRGWRPRRTIVFCNWDAEEYGLIGSTEWVEENRDVLASRAVAYLNVDSAVYGPGLYASATPQLDELLIEVTKAVQDPDNVTQTLYESWTSRHDSHLIGRLGGGSSDFSAFVQHVGIPSIDMSLGNDYPVYHSLYDDFLWVEKFGDPLFHRHVAAASVWGLLALRLADDEILPFNYEVYASELKKYAEVVENETLNMNVDVTPLYASIEKLKKAAAQVKAEGKFLQWGTQGTKRISDPLKLRDLNDRLMLAERALTDPEGLSGRPWYKHLVYGPSQYNDYAQESYPGIADAVKKAKAAGTPESQLAVQHEVHRVARAVKHASLVLSGGLT